MSRAVPSHIYHLLPLCTNISLVIIVSMHYALLQRHAMQSNIHRKGKNMQAQYNEWNPRKHQNLISLLIYEVSLLCCMFIVFFKTFLVSHLVLAGVGFSSPSVEELGVVVPGCLALSRTHHGISF